MGSEPMESSTTRDPLLVGARRDFSAFYGIATTQEAAWFDALVLTRAAYIRAANTAAQDRLHVSAKEIEQANELDEELFVGLRGAVRRSSAFEALSDADKGHIEREVFSLTTVS